MIFGILFALAVGPPVWQIGAFDGTAAGFGLAPDQYRLYSADPTYVVGESEPGAWPYVLPGPVDGWAGGREHRGSIYFGLQGKRAPCRFVCDFVETHYNAPPRLTLWLNGERVSVWQAPAGIADEALNGKPEKGRHASWAVDLPSRALVEGANVLQIRNERGSWVVFDALRLDGPSSLKVVPVPPDLRVETLHNDQVVLKTPEGPRQLLRLEVTNLGKPGQLELSIEGLGKWSKTVVAGAQTVELRIPAVKERRQLHLHMALGGLNVEKRIEVLPVRPWTVYLLPHSHVDIGYTDYQPVVMKMHRANLFDAMAIAQESSAFPQDSRYRFNGEATWILDNLLKDATPDELRQVREAFRKGIMDSSAGYCNTLTGLARPEELMRSYGFATTLRDRLGIDLKTATLTDVPGVTWGTVAALSQAGVRNLVLMPNPSDRIGGVLTAWRDKPFFWVSPSGKERVLVWETASYGVAHGLRHFNGDRTKIFRTADPTKGFIDGYILNRLAELEEARYPYDVIALPWSGTDNFPIDADVPYAVRNWNETYLVPRVVASTVTDACDELVRRFAHKIPVVRGDFTPYWEDGAGSSSRETAMNRASADRLVQAETLNAMGNPAAYDPERFWRAWSDVALYTEHTWGAYNSVSEPDAESVRAQWAYKQNFAVQADKASRELLAQALGTSSGGGVGVGPLVGEVVVNRLVRAFPSPLPLSPQARRGVPGQARWAAIVAPMPSMAGGFCVANTTSWARTDLVVLSREQSLAGDRVVDATGAPIPSQRLRSGELAVLAKDVPAFGTSRFRVVTGPAYARQRASASGWQIESPEWRVTLDSRTGAVARLWNTRLGRDFVDHRSTHGLNEYLYLPGSDLRNLAAPTNPRVEVVEPGPLVARLRVTSSAAGTRGLVQEVQLVAGLDRVDFNDVIDKTAVRAKEGVHFAFPFAVPSGQVRIHGPWAIVRPDLDQIAGSNKNWFNTQYFVDVSNAKFGVTWSSLDAPLMEVGGITANLLGGGYDPKEWLSRIGPTQAIYSWALNNHWYTNYRADQEGALTFRYSVQAHGLYAPDRAYRFGAGLAQPLLVFEGVENAPLLAVSDVRVVVTSLKPSNDGKALIARLWCVSDRPANVTLTWRRGLVRGISVSDSSERVVRPLGAALPIAGWQVFTVRAELVPDNASTSGMRRHEIAGTAKPP